MNSDQKIKHICHCLELLLCESKLKTRDSKLSVKDKVGLLILNFEQNVKNVVDIISKNSDLCHLLTPFKYSELKSNHTNWDFVTLCLVLLKALNENLSLQEKEGPGPESRENEELKGILSVSQENTVKKCLQFIIALGIMPNLILSMKQVLKKRTTVIKILENLETGSCSKKKYCQVVCCLLVLIECLQQRCLKRLILTFHTGDLLVTLFQICYAPIKKIDESKPSDTVSEVPITPITAIYEFRNVVLKIQECSLSTDEEFIKEMLVDRKYFMSVLEQLVKQADASILFWELLLLLGPSLVSNQDPHQGRIRLPIWFQNVCNQLFIEKLMSPAGIETFIRVSLDKMCGSDMETGTVSREKIDTIAKLITLTKVKYMPVELYVKNVSSQVLELFHAKRTANDRFYAQVASSIMLHLLDLNVRLAEYHIFNVIFKPFLLIFEDTALVTEGEISQCVEDAHQIFVLHTSILSPEAMKMLLPFYHLLFIMYTRLINGILFMKTTIEDLLLAILNNSDEDDAVLLLQLSTFRDTSVSHVRSAGHVKCILGDCGGVQIIGNNQSSPDNALEDNNDKCVALLSLIEKVSDKKLRLSYFLSLLKRLTFIESSQRQVLLQNGDLSIFFDHIVYLHLLEELSTQLGEDLINDSGKAIELISGILSCSVADDPYNENAQVTEEKLLAVLPILSTIVGYKEQLTSKHWTDMKTCLPSLEKLIASAKEPFLKDMACDILAAIKTHGAVLKCPNSNKQKTTDDIYFEKKISEISNQLFSSMNIDNANIENKIPVTNISGDFFNPPSSRVHEKQVRECSRPKIEEIPCIQESQTAQKQSRYTYALNDVKDSFLPTRGHGLLTLCTLIEKRDQETLAHQTELLKIFQEHLSDEDSYIYLSAIRGFSALADIDAESVFPILLSEMETVDNEKLDLVLKIGEVFLKICQNLGELTVKYKDMLLNIFLKGTRHEDSQIRASSLSNLGEVCKRLKFAIGPSLQEVLLCVKSLLKTDPDIMVRRSAILVVRLLLQGTGEDTLKILENDIKEIYALLRWSYKLESDDILKLQCSLALEEVNAIMQLALNKQPQLIKEIRIADAL